jgi:pilus assembly protein CpaF
MDLHQRLAGRSSVQPATDDPFAEIKNRIHLAVIGDLGPQLFNSESNPVVLRERVLTDIHVQLERETGIARADRERLVGELADDILGHGPLERLLADETVTEVMVNGPYDIWVERRGRLEETTARFTDESHLRRIINKMVAQVGRRIDESSPMVDARLPDGSRVNAVIPPLSLSGPLVTIRKFSKRRLEPTDLVRLGTLSTETGEFVQRCVLAELNILVTGGTGSGKTTLLNAMSGFIPVDERIVTIEDSAELQLQQPHVVALESRPPNVEGKGQVTIRDLVRNALRMRPDRIVVGEVRGPETLDMLQAMNTGHDGSLTTVHANSTEDSLIRLETLASMSDVDVPFQALRDQINTAIDVIVQLERSADGRRRIIEVAAIASRHRDSFRLATIMAFDRDPIGRDRRVTGRWVHYPLPDVTLERLELSAQPIPEPFLSAADEDFTPVREAGE